MRITNARTIIGLTIEELENFQEFFQLLDGDKSLTLQQTWDVMEAITNEDNVVLNEYGYALEIIDN